MSLAPSRPRSDLEYFLPAGQLQFILIRSRELENQILGEWHISLSHVPVVHRERESFVLNEDITDGLEIIFELLREILDQWSCPRGRRMIPVSSAG
jgi:hypothetical protein